MPPKNRTLSASKRKSSLTDLAYEKIKQLIVTARFKPGEYMNESELCKTFGYTRSPVHQALHRLSSDKLVQIIPRKGVIVQPLSIDEITHILEARKLIEPFCARRAAENASNEEIDQMSALLDLAPTLIENRDIGGLMDVDHRFHELIAKSAKNPVLAETIAGLHIRSVRFWSITWTDIRRLQDVYDEHLGILKEIKARDAEAGSLAMQRHIGSLMKASLGSVS